MNQNPYCVPAPMGRLLSRLPTYPGSVMLAQGLNFVLARHLRQDVWDALEQKKLRLEVTDARLMFDFTVTRGSFAAARHDAGIDLAIAAGAYDFVLLAQRKEDPDTLFFSRRLVMEGDTELGLVIKNALDAIDFPVFDFGRLVPAGWLGLPRPGSGERGASRRRV